MAACHSYSWHTHLYPAPPKKGKDGVKINILDVILVLIEFIIEYR